MTNKIFLPVVDNVCSFCESRADEVELLLVGCTGKAICNVCVEYVRVEMGLSTPPSRLDEIITNATK